MDSIATGDVDLAQPPVVICDAVDALGVHNGVVRVRLSRLTADGASVPALELVTPVSVVTQIVKALQTVRV